LGTLWGRRKPHGNTFGTRGKKKIPLPSSLLYPQKKETGHLMGAC